MDNKVPQDVRERILLQHKAGVSVSVLAKTHTLSRGTVYAILDKAGARESRHTPVTQDQINKVLSRSSYYDKKLAVELSLPLWKIRYIRRKYKDVY